MFGCKTGLVAAVVWVGAVAAADGQQPQTGFLDRVYRGRDGYESKYVVFIPHDYDGKKSFPLILFLHGSGQKGADGRKQVGIGLGPAIRRRENTFPLIAVFPQAHKGGWGATTEDGQRALAILGEVEKAYKVDAERVYLSGLSMGGEGTWSLAAAHPQRWAAIVPVCGGGDPKQAAKIKDIPCWCFHGDADQVVRVKQSRDMIWALRQAGGEPLYHEYPGVGHNCWDRVYATPDLYEWLLELKRKVKGSGPPGTSPASTAGPLPGTGAGRDAKADQGRRKAEAQTVQNLGQEAERFLRLAEAHPDSPAAVADLWWAVRNAPGSEAGKKALGILKGGRLARAGVGEVIGALDLAGPVKELMPHVLDVVKRHLDHPRAAWLLAQVCVSYAHDDSPKAPAAFAEAADLIAERFAASPEISHFCEVLGIVAHPRWAGRFEKHLRAIRSKNRTRLVRCTAHFALASVVQNSGGPRQDEAERLYDQFIKEFSGLPTYPASGVEDSLLAEAKAQLEDLRTWPRMLGKPAPEIEGEDLDGRPMKLSDFRGKVVLLSFWATGCGPCMKLLPHERSLVARLTGKPFAIVGVNGDDPEAQRKALAKNPVPWRSFKNRRGDRQAITQEWKLLGLPTLYLIDRAGIIRKRWIGKPSTEELDREIDTLLAVPARHP
jgi:predicted esterase/thiol-disulfide isomerase/thioredoxin